MLSKQLSNVSKAFSHAELKYYDSYGNDNILTWARNVVYTRILSIPKKGDTILDIASGTGIDAVFYAKHGYKVHAIDITDTMISETNKKIKKFGLQNKITAQLCSYTNLETVKSGFRPFDIIISNFGGLNCISDLQLLTRSIPSNLKPEGFVVIVMLSPICPWEFFYIFKKRSIVTRRLLGSKKGGIKSKIEGVNFIAYYYFPNQVLKAFGKNYTKISQRGIQTIVPPLFMDKKQLTKRYPVLFKFIKL